MNKIAMRVAVLVASLGISGAALAGSETAAPVNGRPMVSPVADAKVAPATGQEASSQLVVAAADNKEQKAIPEAGNATTAVANVKSTEHKAGHDANKQKPEAAAKVDAKSSTPAPVAAQDNNTKK